MAATPPSLQVDVTYRQIWKITLPISFALLIPQLNFITNNIFLGHYDNTGKTLAIAGIAGVYYLIFAAIGNGLNNGLQVLIARRAGENNPAEIGRLFTQGIYLALVVAAAGIFITYFIAPSILKLVIRSSETYQSIVEFLKIRIWGLPFLYIYQMRNALLVGTNQSRYLVAGTFAEAATNFLFDYLLIFGMFGFPELGFNGAAVASIIAEFTGMFVIFLVIRKKGISKRFSLFQNLKWNGECIKQIANISLPIVFQYAFSILSWYFFFILVERNTSPDDQAITNIMRNVFGFFGILGWSFAATTSSMVSNIIGQGKKEMVVELVNKIVKLTTGCSVIIFLLLNLFPDIFISIFGQDENFTQRAIPVIRVVSVATVLMSFSVAYQNAVTGTGNTRITLLIELFAIIGYSVYVFIVLEVLHLSIIIGWMSEWLYWITFFGFSYWYIRSSRWKKKVL